MKTHKSKKVPDFWWDFFWHKGEIVGIEVQSDSDKYPTCGWFPTTQIDATPQIEMAESLIRDYKAGRKTPIAIDLISQFDIKSNADYERS